MATPLFQGELVEDSQAEKPMFSGEPVEETEKPKTTTDRLKQFGGSVTAGTLFGYATPELTQYAGKGIASLPYPMAKAIGYPMEAAGIMMKGERGLATGAGALAGAGGDVAGQLVELKGGTPVAVTMAEMAGGVIAPQLAKTITNVIQYGSRKLLGIDPVSAIKTVADDLGLNEKTLSPSVRLVMLPNEYCFICIFSFCI